MPAILSKLFLFIFAVALSLSAQNSKIRYQANKITILPKKDSVELTGKAILRKGNDKLEADKIIIENQRNFAYAEKNVKFHNRKDNLFFYGEDAEYDMAKNTITGVGYPIVKKPADDIVFSAKKMIGDLQENIFYGLADATLKVGSGAEQNTAKGVDGKYFINLQRMYLSGGVKIFNTQAPEKNAITTCREAMFNIATDVFSCERNARMTNSEEQSFLQAEKFNFMRKENILSASGKPRYVQTNGATYFNVTSLEMEQNQSTDTITLKNNVLAKFYSLESGSLTHEFRCNTAIIANSTINCQGNALLKRIEDNSETSGESIVYNDTTKKGSIEGNPRIMVMQESEPVYLYAEKVLVDDNLKKASFLGNVYISEKEKNAIPPPSNSISCSEGTYFYNTKPNPAEESLNRNIYNLSLEVRNPSLSKTSNTEYFVCNNNVVLQSQKEKLFVYGNTLTHYMATKISKLRGNVHFLKTNSSTETIVGSAEKIDVIGLEEKINFYNYVEAARLTTQSNMVTTNATFKASLAEYHYGNTKNYFEASKNVVLTNLEEKYYVLSEKMQYLANEKEIFFADSPVFTREAISNQKPLQQLVYADEIRILETEQIAELQGNIYLTELPPTYSTPREYGWLLKPLSAAKPNDTNAKSNSGSARSDATNFTTRNNPNNSPPFANRYINCEKGDYYFSEEINTVECYSQTLAVEKSERRTFSTAEASYDVTQRLLSSTSQTTMIEKNKLDAGYRILKGESFELDNFLKEAHLFDKVVLNTVNKDEKLVDEVVCDEGNYTFLEEAKRSLSCSGNLEMQNFIDETLVKGDKLQYFFEENYSIVTGEPLFSWLREEEETIASADLFEYFHDDEVIYGKGNVMVDDGSYEANSSFANYSTQDRKMHLFGNTKIVREDGSEFFAEDVVFDVESRKISFNQKIRGALPFQ